MKPRFLILLSGTLTLGFGYWLAEESRDAREIWLSMGAWILGFWFASSILGLSRPERESIDPETDEFDDED
jgi:hypothetical protein